MEAQKEPEMQDSKTEGKALPGNRAKGDAWTNNSPELLKARYTASQAKTQNFDCTDLTKNGTKPNGEEEEIRERHKKNRPMEQSGTRYGEKEREDCFITTLQKEPEQDCKLNWKVVDENANSADSPTSENQTLGEHNEEGQSLRLNRDIGNKCAPLTTQHTAREEDNLSNNSHVIVTSPFSISITCEDIPARSCEDAKNRQKCMVVVSSSHVETSTVSKERCPNCENVDILLNETNKFNIKRAARYEANYVATLKKYNAIKTALTLTVQELYLMENLELQVPDLNDPVKCVQDLHHYIGRRQEKGKLEMDNLRQQLNYERSSVENLKSNLKNEKLKLEEREQQRGELQKQLQNAQHTLSDCKQLVERNKTEYSDNLIMEIKTRKKCEETISENEAQITRLNMFLGDQKRTIERLENQIKREREIHQTAEKERTGYIRQLQQRMEDLEKSSSELNTKLQITTKEVNYFKSNFQKAFAEKKYLENKVDRLKTAFLKLQESSVKETFENSLAKVTQQVNESTTGISLEEIRRKSEKNIIDQAFAEIHAVQRDIAQWEFRIRKFRGSPEDKRYLDMKELLMRAIDKLDTIESRRKVEIQDRRRNAISYIKGLQELLEEAVKEPESK